MTYRDTQRATVNYGNTLEILVDGADVIHPSLSVKGQLEVSDLNLEIVGVEYENDLKTSEMTIDEDGLSANSLANSETVINSSSTHDVTTDSIEGDVIETNPTTAQNQSTSTASPTPSAIPATPPAAPNNHHHQRTPLVNNDTLPSKPSIPSAVGKPSPEICPGDCDSRICADDVGAECRVRGEQKCDDGVGVMMMMMMMASETVLPDSIDIPLVQLELPNSFPVRALIKTNALTSEPGDDNSTEGADDQSSEFSDDISVIEVQTTAGNDSGAPGERVENENDVTIRNSGSVSCRQDETESREVSVVVNPLLDHRDPEEVTAAEPLPPESSSDGAEKSRMRASLYLPSLATTGGGASKGGGDDVAQSTSKSGETTSAVDSGARDFSQTAPWRLLCKGPAVGGGGSRIDDDDRSSGLPSVTRNDFEAFQTATVDRHQPTVDCPATENAVCLPISIVDRQLRMGSEYSYQRKSSPSIISESQIQERSYPDSLTLAGHVPSPYYQVVRSSNDYDDDDDDDDDDDYVQTVQSSDAATMTTARVYVAPMTSQSTVRLVLPEAEVPAGTFESLRYSSEVLSELQDIPLPTVRDIVADLNSRLLRVAESHVTSTTGSRSAVVELGTSFGTPERRRRRSSSGSESDRDAAIVASLPEFDSGTVTLLGDRMLPIAATYRTDLSPIPPPPSSIRRFSLPGGGGGGGGGAVTAHQQRRVRFAEPPESSVIEIEGRRRRSDSVRPVSAEYGSVSSLAEKLDRIELENALASAAMKRSRPFHPPAPQPPQEVSSLLLAAHHPDVRTAAAAASKRGPGVSRGGTAWRLDPIQERAIDPQPPDTRHFRMAAAQRDVPALNTVHCAASDFVGGGVFSLSVGPGSSAGHLNLSLQGSRQVYAPSNKVNVLLPSAEEAVAKSEPFSTTGTGREAPMRYALPPSYEESVLAMATGRHPCSSGLDEDSAKPVSGDPVSMFPARFSELRAESQLVSGAFPPSPQPGIRMMRYQPSTVPGASSSHHHLQHHHHHHPHQQQQQPGWVISFSPQQDSAHRRVSGCYSQALQMDAESSSSSSPIGRPVFHARSGASSARGRRGSPGGVQGRSEPGSSLVLLPTNISGFGSSKQMQDPVRPSSPLSSPPGHQGQRPSLRRPPDPRSSHLTTVAIPHHPPPHPPSAGETFRLDRRWNDASLPAPIHPTAAQRPPFVRGSLRQAAPPASSSAAVGRMVPDPRGLPPSLQQQQQQQQQQHRMPGMFALLDKTFTDKVMNWEGSNRSGGLQHSETYKLVREMDNAMKQDKL